MRFPFDSATFCVIVYLRNAARKFEICTKIIKISLRTSIFTSRGPASLQVELSIIPWGKDRNVVSKNIDSFSSRFQIKFLSNSNNWRYKICLKRPTDGQQKFSYIRYQIFFKRKFRFFRHLIPIKLALLKEMMMLTT